MNDIVRSYISINGCHRMRETIKTISISNREMIEVKQALEPLITVTKEILVRSYQLEVETISTIQATVLI